MFPGLKDMELTNSCKRELEKISFTSKKFKKEQQLQLYCSTIMETLENDGDLRSSHVGINAQSNTSSKQNRKPDILFHEYESSNFNATGHTCWCAQRNALFPIELKRTIYNKNNTLNYLFNKAVAEIHLDANRSKNGQARFGLIGDGINWVFTETYLTGAPHTKILKYDQQTVNYETYEKFLKRLKSIILFIKQNKPNLMSMKKAYKIGEYISEEKFIFVKQA